MKIHNHNSIAILMATYNGEKYLREQIDSIVNQTNQDWTLFIQDDGSTDSTLDIVKAYGSDKIVLVDLGLTRQGPCMNFMSLLNAIESQYYMFADQDDFWLPRKIELSIERMKEEEGKNGSVVPIIVHTDQSYADSNLKVFRQSSFNPKNKSWKLVNKHLAKMKNPDIIAINTIVGGCAMMFNLAVKHIAFPFTNVRMQDAVLTMKVANAGGIISTINESTMLYRIHSSNTCGIVKESYFAKVRKFRHTLNNNMMGYYIWKIYGKGSFLKFLICRLRIFYYIKLSR